MLRTILASLIAILLPAQGSFASLLVNGSFEEAPVEVGVQNGRTFENLSNGSRSSWDIWETLPGWTTSSGDGVEVQTSRTLDFIDAIDGEHYVELDSNNNSTIFQNVVLGMGHYTLEFYYTPRTTNNQTNAIHYSVGSIVNDWVTGPVSATFPWGEWRRVRAPFEVVTPGTYQVTFAAGGTSDSYGGLLDQVALFAENEEDLPPSIPLPPTMLLMFGAIGGLVSLRRLSIRLPG